MMKYDVIGSKREGYGVAQIVGHGDNLQSVTIYEPETDTPRWVARHIANIYNAGIHVPRGVEEWDLVMLLLAQKGAAFIGGAWRKIQPTTPRPPTPEAQ